MKQVQQSQIFFLRVDLTNPEALVRDFEYHKQEYQLCLLNHVFCFRLCDHSHKKGVFCIILIIHRKRNNHMLPSSLQIKL